jgi:hypothetical protein
MDVHYTWIGPPPGDRNKDIEDPKRTSTRLKGQNVKIYFWCLDEHVSTYTNDFSKHENVTVRGMQSFLSTAASTSYRWFYWYKKSDDWAVSAMTDILKWGLAHGTPPSYRAFVKDAWSLFVMYTWGGYVLDAGVGPLEGSTPVLPEPKTLLAPTLTEDDALQMSRFRMSEMAGPIAQFDMTLNASWLETVCDAMRYKYSEDKHIEDEDCPLLEVWMLASPRYGSGAWAALRQYCLAWGRMEQHKALESENAPQVLRYLIAGSVYNGLTEGNRVPVPKTSLWSCKKLPDGKVEVPALKLRKTYHGSSAK